MISPAVLGDAAGLGVADALLFRLIGSDEWAHVGGLGRGRIWAGSIVLHESEDPAFADVPTEPGVVHRFRYLHTARVLGPYYAQVGAFVRVSSDVLVILGNSRLSAIAFSSDEALRALATALDAEVEDVTPAQARIEDITLAPIMTSSRTDIWSTLEQAADIAAAELSCEVAIVRDGAGMVAATSTWGPVNVGDSEPLNGALDALQALVGEGLLCIQDTSLAELPDPFNWEHGVRSLLIVPIPEPLGGLLVVAHTMGAARGFTDRCLRVGQRIVEMACFVANASIIEDELRENAA